MEVKINLNNYFEIEEIEEEENIVGYETLLNSLIRNEEKKLEEFKQEETQIKEIVKNEFNNNNDNFFDYMEKLNQLKKYETINSTIENSLFNIKIEEEEIEEKNFCTKQINTFLLKKNKINCLDCNVIINNENREFFFDFLDYIDFMS